MWRSWRYAANVSDKPGQRNDSPSAAMCDLTKKKAHEIVFGQNKLLALNWKRYYMLAKQCNCLNRNAYYGTSTKHFNIEWPLAINTLNVRNICLKKNNFEIPSWPALVAMDIRNIYGASLDMFLTVYCTFHIFMAPAPHDTPCWWTYCFVAALCLSC